MTTNHITPRERRAFENQILRIEWVLFNPINDGLIIGTGYTAKQFRAKGFFIVGLL